MSERRAIVEDEVIRAVCLREEGFSLREIAMRLGRDHSVISRMLKRHQETGNYSRRPGQGRPRATTAVDDRFLRLSVLRDRNNNATSLNSQLLAVRNVQVSSRTVRRRLSEYGLAFHRPATGPLLTREHRVARLQFARQHQHWTVEDWGNVLFTDESRFSLRSPDGREGVWRRQGERYAPCNFAERVNFGGGSIMVWGGINLRASTELCVIDRGSITAERYITNILEDFVVPFAPFIGEEFLLMHDNARPHVARVVNEYLQAVDINVLPWPARSPDMNPIEHVWDMVGVGLVRTRQPLSLAILRSVLVEEWNNIPEADISHLIEGMPRRISALLTARGANTKY